MRLRTKLFLSWGGLLLLMWAGILWPVQRTVRSNFRRVAAEGFTGTKRSLYAVQAERVKQMRHAGWLVMNIPELRALIAEHNYELSTDNLASLEERLNGLKDMVGVNFVCVLDNRGNLIAQNQQSPWATLGELQDYLLRSPQAASLVHHVFTASANSQKPGGDHDAYGLWVHDKHLYQVVAVPLIFSSGEDSATAETDGALIMATQITDDLASELGKGHDCQLTFISDGNTVASSVPAALRSEMEADYRNRKSASVEPFDSTLGGEPFRSSIEPLLDPSSGTSVGSMLIQSSLADAQAFESRVINTLLVILVTGMVLAGIGSYVLSGAVTKPVNDLLAGVKKVAGGDLELALRARGHDELGELANAFNDMVAQLRTRRELQRLVEESQAASRSKSQFLANMSHEIRTPLNGVIGMAELLLSSKLDERQHRYATLAKASAEVLTSLINDILDFSKIEAGKLDIESIEFPLHTVVEDVCDMLAPKAFKKGLEVVCDVGNDVPMVIVGDPNRLRQILINLLNNAIKFTQTGEVVVRVTSEIGDDDRSMIRFAVSDTGIGIPPDRVDRLFKSFSQVDASTTRKFGGTGLGLAISKQLAELMGGKIGVESHDGSGSTFWFSIQLNPATSPQPAAVKIVAENPRVLLFEPHDSTRNVMIRRLTSWGLHVTVAASRDEAAMLARDGSFGLAILTESLTSISAATAKLLLLKNSDAVDSAAIAQDGFAGYLTKPLRGAQMLNAIEKGFQSCASSGVVEKNPGLGGTSDTGLRGDVEVSKTRILLAEDYEVNQLIVVEMLGQVGHRCDVVSDGLQAVEAAASGKYELILMDCQMPGMDGFEAARAIRQNEIGGPRHVAIIALTANAMSGDRERCITAGMDAYCSKPIDRRRLLETVASFLSLDNADAESAVEPVIEPIVTAPVPLDMEVLRGRCSGKQSLMNRVLEKFSTQANDAMVQLENSTNRNSAQQVARISHGLKGTAGMAAATGVHRIAAQLEELGRADDLEQLDDCLTRLRDEIDRCNSFIQQSVVVAAKE